MLTSQSTAGLSWLITYVLVEGKQTIGFDGLRHPTDIGLERYQNLATRTDPNFYILRTYIPYWLCKGGNRHVGDLPYIAVDRPIMRILINGCKASG